MKKIKVLFVCMGNICRSPMAEGIFTEKARQRGYADYLIVDSAGTHDYHIGAPPDARAQQTMLAAGYDISDLRGRQVSIDDLINYDYILAMDDNNLSHLKRMAGPNLHKVDLFLRFSEKYTDQCVPDPYYGDQHNFDQVLLMSEDAAQGLLTDIASNHMC